MEKKLYLCLCSLTLVANLKGYFLMLIGVKVDVGHKLKDLVLFSFSHIHV